MTTVRDLKDEVDKRACHKMLKQLGLSEKMSMKEETMRTFVYPARFERGDRRESG